MKIDCPKLEIPKMHRSLEVADLCMGWFWEPDNHFSNLDGVEEVIVGYAGGKELFPTYECKKDYVEAVRIIFDPTVISYDEIIEHFLEQGGLPLCGGRRVENFKASIIVHSEAQRASAEATIRMLKRTKLCAVLPTIEPPTSFYRAEEYHQKYLRKLSELHSFPVSMMWSTLLALSRATAVC